MFVLSHPARSPHLRLLLSLTVLGILSNSKLRAEDVAHQAKDTLKAYYSGNGLLNRGLYDLAEQEYQSFLASHANHEKAYVARYGLAVTLFRQEKFFRVSNRADYPTRFRSKGIRCRDSNDVGAMSPFTSPVRRGCCRFFNSDQIPRYPQLSRRRSGWRRGSLLFVRLVQ